MKKWVIGIALALLALGALAGAGAWMLTRYALPWVTGRIEKTTGYEIRARSMDFNFRRGIALEDVHVMSPEKKEVGTARRFYVRPDWNVLIRHRELVIDEVSIDLPEGQLRGRGQVSKDLDADVQLEFRANKTRRSSPPSGVLSAKLVKGRGKMIARLSHGALQVSATAQVDVPNKKIEASLRTGRYNWQPGTPQPWDIRDLSVQLKGNLSRWNVQVLTHLRGDAVLRYQGAVEKQEAAWRIEWERIALHLAPDTDWRTTRPGYATWDEKNGFMLPDLRLTDGSGSVQLAALSVGRPAQDLTLNLDRVAPKPLIDWISPGRGISGTLDGQAHLQGPAESPNGTINVVLSSGQVQGAVFQHVQAKVKLAPPWIILEHVEMAVPQTDRSVTGSGRLPWHLVQAASPNLPMDLHFKVEDTDPRMLGGFMPGCTIDPGGHLGVQAVIRGTYPDVTVVGTATLNVPGLRYPQAGVDMKNLELELQSRGKWAEITKGYAQLGKGVVRLGGHINWPVLDLVLLAEKATFTLPKKLDMKTDGELRLKGNLQAPELTGEIRPKEGTYTEAKKEKKEKEKEKEEPQTAAEPSAMWKSLHIDIRTVWDHGLWYRDGLTKIETGGDLHIRKARGAERINLSGPLTLLRGSYDAYGRDFVIDAGNINFTGSEEINPILSIQAQFRTVDYLITLSVSGHLKPKPDLHFTSSPPLSEQEIISVLVTGARAKSFGGADAGADDQAKQAAADVASSYLTRSLRESGLNLGLDVVRVTPSATGTVWTVGRYLGPDLFVSYGQNPKDSASSVVNADYSLSKRWSVNTQASSNSDTYVDFLFRYPIKKRSSKK